MSEFDLHKAAWEMYSLYGRYAPQVCAENAQALERDDTVLEKIWKDVGKAAGEFRPPPGMKHLHEV